MPANTLPQTDITSVRPNRRSSILPPAQPEPPPQRAPGTVATLVLQAFHTALLELFCVYPLQFDQESGTAPLRCARPSVHCVATPPPTPTPRRTTSDGPEQQLSPEEEEEEAYLTTLLAYC